MSSILMRITECAVWLFEERLKEDNKDADL